MTSARFGRYLKPRQGLSRDWRQVALLRAGGKCLAVSVETRRIDAEIRHKLHMATIPDKCVSSTYRVKSPAIRKALTACWESGPELAGAAFPRTAHIWAAISRCGHPSQLPSRGDFMAD